YARRGEGRADRFRRDPAALRPRYRRDRGTAREPDPAHRAVLRRPADAAAAAADSGRHLSQPRGGVEEHARAGDDVSADRRDAAVQYGAVAILTAASSDARAAPSTRP